MDDELDPEVAADIALRNSSMNDSSRSRGMGIYDWKPPAAAEYWPCRRCGASCMVPDAAVEAANVFDRQLKRKLEPPLDRNKIMFCRTCNILKDEYGQRINRKQVDVMRDLIAELKNEPRPSPKREVEITTKLREIGHPLVDELVAAIAERRERDGNKSNGRKRL